MSVGRGSVASSWSGSNVESNTNATGAQESQNPNATPETTASDRSAAAREVVEEEVEAEIPAPSHGHNGAKSWGVSSPEGGSSKALKWRKEKGGGWGAWFASISFLLMLGLSPLIPHFRKNAKPMTKWHYMEASCYFLWLILGYVCFTQKIVFQSPHFQSPRTLSTEEAVYLIAQIVTTVGYGDITPAKAEGQMFVGFFVFFAIMFVSKMLGEMVAMFQDMMEDMIMDDPDDDSLSQGVPPARKLWNAFVPVIQAGVVFLIFLTLGALFYWLCPGEGKDLHQGLYMSLITLSSVGFGAFTPSTHAGMVFGAYWMLFGVGSLASFVSARVAFHAALVRHEHEMQQVLQASHSAPQ